MAERCLLHGLLLYYKLILNIYMHLPYVQMFVKFVLRNSHVKLLVHLQILFSIQYFTRKIVKDWPIFSVLKKV